MQNAKLASHIFEKFVAISYFAALLYNLGGTYILDPQGNHYIFYVFGLGMLFLSIFLFAIGWRYYIHIKPYDSVIINCIPVYKNAVQTWLQSKKSEENTRIRCVNGPVLETMHSGDGFATETIEESITSDERPSVLLDHAKVVHNGRFLDRVVEDVKLLQSALVIFFIFVLPYRVISNQVGLDI